MSAAARATEQGPLVTVVIPVFNGAKFIGRALTSVLEQSMANFELFVVDDGSTDETAAVVQRFSDPRLTYVHQVNAGPGAARNAGIRLARGSWVAILDADDYWAPSKLEAQLERAALAPAAALIYTAAQYRNPDDEVVAEVPALIEDGIHGELLVKNHIVASSAMIRRDILDRVGLFEPELSGCEDWDLWLRIAEVAEVASVKQPLVSIVRRPESLSSNTARMRDIGLRVIARALDRNPDLEPTARRRAYWACHYAAAIAYQAQGRPRAALQAAAAAMLHRPAFMPGYWRVVRILAGQRD